MASAGEAHLTQNLVDPETLDNPEGGWTKGEEQPRGFRDAWAGVLFYASVVAIAAVAGALGVPAVEKYAGTDASAGSEGVDYTGLMYASFIAGGSSFALSGLSLFVMSCCPRVLIKIALLFSLAMSLAMVAAAFYFGNVVAGAIGVVLLLLNLCYAYAVWSRIPFAAANLNAGLTAVKRNGGVFVVAFAIVAVSYLYSMMWMTAMVGVYDKEGLCAAANSTDVGGGGGSGGATTTVQCNGNLFWGYFFLLLLALYWAQQVFKNTIHTIIAGVVSTWWFAPDEASSCCSRAIGDSFARATTRSFGSICFGSLLVAIVQTLRAMANAARQDDPEGCGAVLLCLVECILACIEGMLEYFNKWAYIYVGMYGYGYLEAGKNVMRLFVARGWSVIIADDLVDNVLFLFVILVGCFNGVVGLAINAAYPSWFDGLGDPNAAMGVAFGFSFLIGLVVSSVLLSVVDSSVNTVLVAFAEAPREFEENHPDHSSEMREAWMRVYPAECGF